MKRVYISHSSVNGPRMIDCYCHVQIYTVPTKIFHNRYSACPVCIAKHYSALLIL